MNIQDNYKDYLVASNKKAIRWWFLIFYWEDYNHIEKQLKKWLCIDYYIPIDYWIIKWKNFIINKQ